VGSIAQPPRPCPGDGSRQPITPRGTCARVIHPLRAISVRPHDRRVRFPAAVFRSRGAMPRASPSATLGAVRNPGQPTLDPARATDRCTRRPPPAGAEKAACGDPRRPTRLRPWRAGSGSRDVRPIALPRLPRGARPGRQGFGSRDGRRCDESTRPPLSSASARRGSPRSARTGPQKRPSKREAARGPEQTRTGTGAKKWVRKRNSTSAARCSSST
jgi:hypothetical protein